MTIPKHATHISPDGNYYHERGDGQYMLWLKSSNCWHPSPAANRGEIDLRPLSKTAHSANNCAHLPVTPEEDDAWEEGERRMRQIASNGPSGIHYDAPLLSDEEQSAIEQTIKGFESVPKMSKYHAEIKQGVWIDVYDVLSAFNVTNPALQHLIKKALKPGDRGHKDKLTDMQDIIDSAVRAKELEL